MRRKMPALRVTYSTISEDNVWHSPRHHHRRGRQVQHRRHQMCSSTNLQCPDQEPIKSMLPLETLSAPLQGSSFRSTTAITSSPHSLPTHRLLPITTSTLKVVSSVSAIGSISTLRSSSSSRPQVLSSTWAMECITASWPLYRCRMRPKCKRSWCRALEPHCGPAVDVGSFGQSVSLWHRHRSNWKTGGTQCPSFASSGGSLGRDEDRPIHMSLRPFTTYLLEYVVRWPSSGASGECNGIRHCRASYNRCRRLHGYNIIPLSLCGQSGVSGSSNVRCYPLRRSYKLLARSFQDTALSLW